MSIIIPSCNDSLLQKTIDDIRQKAKGGVEIVVVLDGYPQEVKDADVVLLNEERKGMRATINRGVAASRGNYIGKTDAHCMFDEGFDVKLLSNIEDNWIVVPRRYALNTETWELMNEPPVDCERLIVNQPDKIGGTKWRTRARERRHVSVDETMVFQGSFWLMSKKHWNWLGGEQEKGYGTFTQEPIELSLKTWLGGGRVMVNKTTWYAHKHRSFGRSIAPSGKEVRAGNLYSKDFWLNNRWTERKHDLDWLMKRFGL